MKQCCILLLLGLYSCPVVVVKAIIPSKVIKVVYKNGGTTSAKTYLASAGNFGPEINDNDNNIDYIPMLAPQDDELLCNGPNDAWMEMMMSAANRKLSSSKQDDHHGHDHRIVMLAPRGTCTFEKKTQAAEAYGASALIIYGNLGSFYGKNETTGELVFPEAKEDYDCGFAEAFVDSSSVTLPYNSTADNKLFTGDTSLCGSAFNKQCPSQRCLLTGNYNEGGRDTMQACCAWDLHIYLYHDESLTIKTNIPAVYVSMAQGDELIQAIESNNIDYLQIYARSRGSSVYSSIVVWALGTFTACIAAFISSSAYRQKRKDLNTSGAPSMAQLRPSSSSAAASTTSTTQHSETLELTATHAAAFIVITCISLLVLFYLQIFSFIKVMYAIGCAGAMSQVLVIPGIKRYASFKGTSEWWSKDINHLPFDLGTLNRVELLGMLICYSVAGYWLYLAFALIHPSEESIYFWIVQDIMGMSICILFLSTVLLPNVKVASILLWALFTYDIFFVFISPYFFSESVMINVATQGGPPPGDPTFCEKYPRDRDCIGGDPMPMLLTFPRLFDYAGGMSMLGLGDIVIPGLLLSFGSRLDEAKKLVAVCSRDDQYTRTTTGYFRPLCVAYGVGLAMANIAVNWMKMGQPALLYLVPCTLGTVYYISSKNKEFHELWTGPLVLNQAEDFLDTPHNDDYSEGNSSPPRGQID